MKYEVFSHATQVIPNSIATNYIRITSDIFSHLYKLKDGLISLEIINTNKVKQIYDLTKCRFDKQFVGYRPPSVLCNLIICSCSLFKDEYTSFRLICIN